jgi:hypothetical protein
MGKIWKINTNSVALIREQTIPTERPPLVGEQGQYFMTRIIYT